jgi:hypothetical protein
MYRRGWLVITLTVLLTGSPVTARAEQPSLSGDAVRLMAKMPTRGSTMNSVREGLGRPERVVGPVGDPPITRWVYEQFTVYFEHDRVLHSVKSPTE